MKLRFFTPRKRSLFFLTALMLFTRVYGYDFQIGGLFYKFVEGKTDEVAVTYEDINYDRYGAIENYISSSSSSIPETVTYNSKIYKVTAIGDHAFEDCQSTSFHTIEIPSTITSIGEGAFADTWLWSISIPSSVTYIGSGAFYGCTSLRSVELPVSLKKIEDYTFEDCRSLTSIIIPENVTEIGYKAFENCRSLTSINIPDKVTTIGSLAFWGCSKLSSLSFPEDIASIGYKALEGTAWLNNQPNGLLYIGKVAYQYRGTMPANTEITIKDGTMGVSGGAFLDCTGLKSIIIPESINNIGEDAFKGCSGLTEVEVYCSVVGDWFKGNKSLNKLTLGESITDIGDVAFNGCTGLTTITIPSKVHSIGNYAFEGCTNLATISIPNSVTSIGTDAFIATAWYNQQQDGLIYVGKVLYKYKGTMPANTHIDILDGTKGIASNAFYSCIGLTSVKIPNTVSNIGRLAFYGCSSLLSVDIPSSVEVIDRATFSNCSKLSEVIIPNSVINVGEYAFKGCTGLELLSLPNSLKVIESDAFRECSQLKSVISYIENPFDIHASVFWGSLSSSPTLYVPDGKKETYQELSGWNQFPNIEEMSRDWNTDLTIVVLDEDKGTVQIGNGKEAAISANISGELVIPSKVTRYGKTYTVVSLADSAFYACNKLTSVEIPSSIKSSGKDAFSGCSGLKKVIVSDLKAWCAIAFSNKASNPLYYAKHLYSDANTEIIDLVIPEGVAKINAYAFIKGSFKTVSIPSSVTDINSHSFYKCTSLTSANMAKGVGKIHTNAFYGCTALTSVTLPEGMTRIGTSSFYQCTALEEIELPASISEIATTAFKLCSNLKQVTSRILSPKAFGTESFASISADCKLYIPVGTLPKYHSVGWTKDVFVGGIVEVGDVEVNYNIENGVTADFIKNVVYPNDDYSFTKITDYTTVATSYRKDLPQPVRIEAPITNDGKALVLETYSNGVLVRSDNFLVGQRALEIWNLIPQTQYTYKLYLVADDDTKSEVSQGAFKTEGQVRMMKIDNVRNFRDIGGWKLANGKYIKYDKIFRSAELATTSQIINTSGIDELLDVQGIGVEIDFANPEYSAVSPVSDYLEHIHGDNFQITGYVDGVKNKSDKFKNCFEKVVSSLRDGKKILFHCNAGADRTGTFAFLLEGLLGVSESDLAKDYELTSFVYANRHRNIVINTIENAKYLDYKGLIDYVMKTFKGETINEKIEQMALRFGITQKDINDFRDLMTEPNALSLSDVSILKDNTAKCSVNMANKNEIAAFQFDVEMPQGITLTGVQLGNRKSSSHTVEFSKNEDGSYRVVCVSLQSVSFSGNEGELISLMLSEDGTIKKGDYDISIKNIVLTSPSNVKYYPADASALLTVLDCRQGDADGDGIIDVADVVLMVNYIIGKPSTDFVFQASDLNGDGEIDVFDVMMAINLVLSQNSSSRSYVRDANETTLGSMFMTIDNEGVNLSIDNPGRFSAFQFELALPEGTMLTEAKLADSKDTHLIKFDQIGTNCYRVMAVSLDNLAFSTTASELLRLTLSSNNGASAVIDNIRFVTPEGEKVLFSVSHENSATAIKEIVKEQEAVIYDLSGRKFTVSENLPKGVYIINNKKVVIK